MAVHAALNRSSSRNLRSCADFAVFCGVAACAKVENGSSGVAEAIGAVALSGDAESADFLASQLYDEQVSTEQ